MSGISRHFQRVISAVSYDGQWSDGHFDGRGSYRGGDGSTFVGEYVQIRGYVLRHLEQVCRGVCERREARQRAGGAAEWTVRSLAGIAPALLTPTHAFHHVLRWRV